MLYCYTIVLLYCYTVVLLYGDFNTIILYQNVRSSGGIVFFKHFMRIE